MTGLLILSHWIAASVGFFCGMLFFSWLEKKPLKENTAHLFLSLYPEKDICIVCGHSEKEHSPIAG